MSKQFTCNPKLAFAIERFIDAPTRLVWEALTKPEHLTEWYMSKPWEPVLAEELHSIIDSRSPGVSRLAPTRGLTCIPPSGGQRMTGRNGRAFATQLARDCARNPEALDGLHQRRHRTRRLAARGATPHQRGAATRQSSPVRDPYVTRT